MKLVYLIENDTGGAPVYFDPSIGRQTGHGMMGWTDERGKALGFATAADAQKFIDALPNLGAGIRPVPYTRKE